MNGEGVIQWTGSARVLASSASHSPSIRFANRLAAEDCLTKLLAIDGIGEKLDRYELISEIASGGMATVFLARNVGVAGFQRLIAIKRLHPHLAKDPDFVDMFLDEARLAARIHHPHVVSIQEVGQNEHGYYLVMDYVEGATLGKLLTRAAREGRRIPADVAIRIMLDTLGGLHAAHELQDDDGQALEIVHRDVSPQNILLGADGVARLTDFGVARAEAKISITKTGQLKGKLAYMAPEQAQGKRVDRRADLFACGIVLWESLALRRLFKGDTDAEVLNKVLHEEIPGLREATQSVSVALEAVVAKALARKPEDRYPTALAFADALEQVAKDQSMLASPRDLARCLDAFFGEELTGHRESIRSLLSSGPHSLRVGTPLGTDSYPPPQATAVTRVGEQPKTVADRAVLRDGVPSSSGHSTAAIHLEGQRLSTPPSPPGPRMKRWGLVLALGMGFGVLASVGFVAYQQRQAASVAPPAPTVPAEPPTATPLPAPAPVLAGSAPVPADQAPHADAASAPAASGPIRKGRGGRPHGTSTSPPAGGGDDIGRNPYRQ